MSKEKPWNISGIELFKTPLPRETRTYKPVAHQMIDEVTMEAIEKAGFKLGGQRYTCAQDGLIANGRYTITDVADSEMRLEIGWQNSYNKTLSLKFAIGTMIIVCENGCVSGDFGAFKRKHVGEIREFAPTQIIEYIKTANDSFKEIQAQREMLKQIEATKRVQAEILGRMFFEEDIIRSSQLEIIKKEMLHPTHDYKAAGSMWELYNHTTFAMKDLHPQLWMDNHIKVHDFFVKRALVKPETIIESLPPLVNPAQLSLIDQIEAHA